MIIITEYMIIDTWNIILQVFYE